MEEKFDALLAEFRRSQDEVCQFRREVEDKFDASIAELKHEVNQAQERTSQEVARKIGNSTYQFMKKGQEHQYRFNCEVVEAISSAQADLSKLKPENRVQKTALDSEGYEGLGYKVKTYKNCGLLRAWMGYCCSQPGRSSGIRS